MASVEKCFFNQVKTSPSQNHLLFSFFSLPFYELCQCLIFIFLFKEIFGLCCIGKFKEGKNFLVKILFKRILPAKSMGYMKQKLSSSFQQETRNEQVRNLNFSPSASLFLFYIDTGKGKVKLSRHFEKSEHGRWDLLLYLSIPLVILPGKANFLKIKCSSKDPGDTLT